MWHVNLLTLFPEMFPGPLGQSLGGRALEDGKWSYTARNIRDFATDKHKTVDDTPFGGGAGMVMRPDVIEAALLSRPNSGRKIYMSPRGKPLTQEKVRELARLDGFLLLCGHYEGVDERALQLGVDEEISLGDFVLTGGELAAMAIVDAVSRLVPGVLGSSESAVEESFSDGLLEYPQYSRPREYRGLSVPEVLVNGNHAEINRWRRRQALLETLRRRPDLFDKAPMTEKERAETLAALREETEAHLPEPDDATLS